MAMLPFHRFDRGAKPQKTEGGVAETSRPKRAVKFFVQWLKVSWKDIILMALLGGASQAIYTAPLAAVRNFPITFDASGDIVYPAFAYPDRGWIISPQLSAILSCLVPIAVILLAQVRIRSFWDVNNAIFGLLFSLILGTLFQVILKQLIGGFRPYFLEVCRPDITLATSHNSTGLNAVGFRQIMYTVDVCTNPDAKALQNAMTSFPSGHSTAAFAGYIFLFLWMNAKMKVFANYQASFWQLSLLFAPLLAAALIVCSLTIDQAHNWYDILAGSTIGTITAFASYRVCYAAVWDWRFNHLPLKRGEVFDYLAVAQRTDGVDSNVFIRKLGWGRRRKAKVEPEMGQDSTRSSATLPHGQEDPVPERRATRQREQAVGQEESGRAVAGDHMV